MMLRIDIEILKLYRCPADDDEPPPVGGVKTPGVPRAVALSYERPRMETILLAKRSAGCSAPVLITVQGEKYAWQFTRP
jgi:hypothetical protein